MVYRVDDLIRRVRVALDLNATDNALLNSGDEETLQLDRLIRSRLEEATRRVHLEAPYYDLELGHTLQGWYEGTGAAVETAGTMAPGGGAEAQGEGAEVEVPVCWDDPAAATDDEAKCGWVALPDDFLRMVVFRMSDWERPVYNTISALDPEYALQRSRYKGLRGTPQRPVAAVTVKPHGRVLEFYSCRSQDAVVEEAVYVPEPKIDRYGGIDISEKCIDKVVYTTAALVCAAVGDNERMQMMNQLSTPTE